MNKQANKHGGFLRVLGRLDVITLAFGAMIGWSWVILPGDWIGNAGTLGAVIAFLAGGGAILLVGLTYAELASALPFAGGEHVYSHRALGANASFICTWAIILGYMSVICFETVALPTVLNSLLEGSLNRVYLWEVAGWEVYLPWALVGVGGAVVMSVLNLLGVRFVAVVQTTVVLMILVVGGLFIAGAGVSGDTSNLQPLLLQPLLPAGLAGIAVVMAMVPFMFLGFDVIPQAAEEIDLPFKHIGGALILSVVMAIAWYSLIIVGVGMLAVDQGLLGSEVVTAEAGSLVYGEGGRLVLLVTGLAGIITTWNALIVGASRAIYAMARAGMLPGFLGQLHPRYHTPANAIILIGVLSVFTPWFGRPALLWMVDAGSFGIVIAYVMVALSFLVLRRREPELPRPYRVPAGMTVGTAALLLTLAALPVLYLLPERSLDLMSLLGFLSGEWPRAEWVIILFWASLGVMFYGIARLSANRG